MGTKIYKTIVKEYHPLCNDFVMGKIIGIAYAVSKRAPKYAISHYDDGSVVITNDFTEEEYTEYKDLVKKMHSDLCDFIEV